MQCETQGGSARAPAPSACSWDPEPGNASGLPCGNDLVLPDTIVGDVRLPPGNNRAWSLCRHDEVALLNVFLAHDRAYQWCCDTRHVQRQTAPQLAREIVHELHERKRMAVGCVERLARKTRLRRDDERRDRVGLMQMKLQRVARARPIRPTQPKRR